MSKREGIQTNISIADGILSYQDTMIQTRNISRVSIEPMEKEKIPIWSILGAVFSLLIYLVMEKGIFFLCVIVFLGVIIFVCYSNSNLGMYIVLSLNSGEKVYFSAYEDNFMKLALKEIVTGIKENKHTMINLNNCTIHGGNIAAGDILTNSEKTVAQNNSSVIKDNSESTININQKFKMLEKEFAELMLQHSVDSKEYRCCELAYSYCTESNASGLKKFIEKNISVFRNMLGNVVPATIVELIKLLTGISL